MAKVRQPFGETRFVPWLGRDVNDGEVVDVPDVDLPGYLEGGWEPADKATTAAHQKLLEDGKVTVGKLRKPKAEKAEGPTAEGATDGATEDKTEGEES